MLASVIDSVTTRPPGGAAGLMPIGSAALPPGCTVAAPTEIVPVVTVTVVVDAALSTFPSLQTSRNT